MSQVRMICCQWGIYWMIQAESLFLVIYKTISFILMFDHRVYFIDCYKFVYSSPFTMSIGDEIILNSSRSIRNKYAVRPVSKYILPKKVIKNLSFLIWSPLCVSVRPLLCHFFRFLLYNFLLVRSTNSFIIFC